jgi:hypothetical protein
MSPARRLAISFFKLAEYALARSLALICSLSAVGPWLDMVDSRLPLEGGSALERRVERALGRTGFEDSEP